MRARGLVPRSLLTACLVLGSASALRAGPIPIEGLTPASLPFGAKLLGLLDTPFGGSAALSTAQPIENGPGPAPGHLLDPRDSHVPALAWSGLHGPRIPGGAGAAGSISGASAGSHPAGLIALLEIPKRVCMGNTCLISPIDPPTPYVSGLFRPPRIRR